MRAHPLTTYDSSHMSATPGAAGAGKAVAPVRVLRATGMADGYQLTVDGAEEVLGSVRGKHIFRVHDLVAHSRWRSTGVAEATAGGRTWTLEPGPDGNGLVVSEAGSQAAALTWADESKSRLPSLLRSSVPVAHIARPGQPDLRLFISEWQHLNKQQQRAAWPDGHWSLQAPGAVGVMNFGFSTSSATRIFIGVFPAGDRDPAQLLVALLCCHEICRWRATGHASGVT